MARNDGIDRTVARNQDLETPADVAKVQEHNEREKDSYSNQDIVPERTSLNVHFKAPTDDYVKMFEQMEQDGVISTRGLKPDAVKYGELVFDVNSAYFYNHGGYEFAKQFYADAYKAAVEFCSAIEAAGYDAMIYSNMLWEAYELDLEKLSAYPVWYADYELKPQTPYHFEVWQYTNQGSVDGINGRTDINIQLIEKPSK